MTQNRDPEALVEVPCAFCGGTGRDPFDLMSPLSKCQVCGGNGVHLLQRPLAHCAFCRGTGVYPHSRNTCTACRGVGQVEIQDGALPCPRCGGSARAAQDHWPDSPLPCSHCRGTGIILPNRGAR
jgi:DnaJ-class molecular chaperone